MADKILEVRQHRIRLAAVGQRLVCRSCTNAASHRFISSRASIVINPLSECIYHDGSGGRSNVLVSTEPPICDESCAGRRLRRLDLNSFAVVTLVDCQEYC